MSHGSIVKYKGNYSRYIEQSRERRKALERAYEKQQEHIHQTEEYIRRFKAGIKAKQARGRQSQLNRLERIELDPKESTLHFRLRLLRAAARRYSSLTIYVAVMVIKTLRSFEASHPPR